MCLNDFKLYIFNPSFSSPRRPSKLSVLYTEKLKADIEMLRTPGDEAVLIMSLKIKFLPRKA